MQDPSATNVLSWKWIAFGYLALIGAAFLGRYVSAKEEAERSQQDVWSGLQDPLVFGIFDERSPLVFLKLPVWTQYAYVRWDYELPELMWGRLEEGPMGSGAWHGWLGGHNRSFPKDPDRSKVHSLSIWIPGSVTKTLEFKVPSGQVNLGEINLPLGDLDRDNYISHAEVKYVRDCIGKSWKRVAPTLSEEDSETTRMVRITGIKRVVSPLEADIDDDGDVDMFDYNLVKDNAGVRGDPVDGPKEASR